MNLIKLQLNDLDLAFGSALQRLSLRFWQMYGENRVIDVELIKIWKDDLFKDVKHINVDLVLNNSILVLNCKTITEEFKWEIDLDKPLYLCASLNFDGTKIEEINIFAFRYEI